MKIYLFISFTLISVVGGSLLLSSGYAHNFTPSEDASFISLMDDLKSTILLAKTSISDNATLVREYSYNAYSILDNSTLKEISERNRRLANNL